MASGDPRLRSGRAVSRSSRFSTPTIRAAGCSLTELRDLYRQLGLDGVLLGQPVGLGSDYGVLRIAIGARTLHDEALQANLQQLFTRIERRTTPR